MRCQHCYADIREARLTEYAATDLTEGKPLPSTWLSANFASPFCVRDLCAAGGFHEIKHAPMPVV
jgi:hypothetical protein